MRPGYLSTLNEVLKGVLLVLCVYGTTDYAQAKESVDLSNRLAGGNHIYLTHLSLYMTITTLALSYCVKHFKVSGIEEVYRDFLAVTLPMEGLVTTVFWMLNWIDPTMLKNRDLYIAGVRTPLIGELSLHLLPLILLLADQAGVHIQEKTRHYLIFVLFAAIYFVVIHYFQQLNKCWVYPFLDNVSMPTRVALIAMVTLLVLAYYKLFLKLSTIINTRIRGLKTKLP